MNEIFIDENAEKIIRRLNDAGFEAYVVGGCVRDAVLGKNPHDWDITTDALPSQVKALFEKTVDTGIKYGTVTVMLDGSGYEVTTFRLDGGYSDGRRPDTVSFSSSIEEDLGRRDFTINAVAYSPDTGFIDPFGGMEDIAGERIRTVGDPVKRFSEDALRMMRAFRFKARLGFSMEPGTAAAICGLRDSLSMVSAERISSELEKILMSDHPEVLAEMYDAGIMEIILPEFDICMKTAQNNPHHMYTVGEHIIKTVTNVRKDRILRLAAFLHDIGKPAARTTDDKGIDHFYGHAEKSAEMAKAVLKRLRYDNRTIDAVTAIILEHEMQIRITPARVRRETARIGKDIFRAVLELRAADIKAQSLYQRDKKEADLKKIKGYYDNAIASGDCLSLKELAVNGDDLVELGYKGRKIGHILNGMFTDVLNEPKHNDRDYLLSRYACI